MCVVLFGINSPKMSVLFDMNSDKRCGVLLLGGGGAWSLEPFAYTELLL